MATVVREVRGIPLWLIREYLEELGGTARGEHFADGDGWTGALEQIEDFTIGSLAIGQVRITLEGKDDVVERVNTLLDDKLLRAGG